MSCHCSFLLRNTVCDQELLSMVSVVSTAVRNQHASTPQKLDQPLDLAAIDPFCIT